MTKCKLCSECNSDDAHTNTPQHLKNKVLYFYSQNRKRFSGNRRGIKVTCDASSNFTTVKQCTEGRIKLSAKPNETIRFNFEVENETRNEEILVIGIHLTHEKLKFKMSDHGIEFGGKVFILKPKHKVPKKIEVTFKSDEIGQYEMPVLFYFQTTISNDAIVIIREIIVYVETKPIIHEKVKNPYSNKEVVAKELIKCDKSKRKQDYFRIPKEKKTLFSNCLHVPANASEDEKNRAEKTREIFEKRVTFENYIDFFQNLLWYEEAIVRINLKKYNMTDWPLQELNGSYWMNVPGLAEKRPSLMIGDLVFVRPHDDDTVMFEGTVSKIESNSACIEGLDLRFNEVYKRQRNFDVRFFLSRMPFERMHHAIVNVFKTRQKPRLFPEEAKVLKPLPEITQFLNPLVGGNPEQALAVRHMVGGSSGAAPYVLHGPPGTGKTITIVEAVLQLVKKNPKNRILVCTDSNMAADHVACQLIKYHAHFNNDPNFLIRANSQFRGWESMPEALKNYSNGRSYGSFRTVNRERLNSYSIAVTTISHVAKFAREPSAPRPITHLFIDEAAQASEPTCLIPVTGLLQASGQLVLAGDHLQLGPVLVSHKARNIGLGKSLMERLMEECKLYSEEVNDPRYTIMLKKNFRNHADILDIPNQWFYGGSLESHAESDPLTYQDVLGERQSSRGIVFHGVCSKESRIGASPSYYNAMELELVEKYVLALTSQRGVKPQDIGVITPYLRQVYKVKNMLHTHGFGKAIEVGTVEAFQGKEKRVIIISTVRANCGLFDYDAKFQLGFLVDKKRFNVALTRAKSKAIVIGNPLCLQKDAKWKHYMAKCREYNTYFGFDPEVERNTQIENDLVNILKNLEVVVRDDTQQNGHVSNGKFKKNLVSKKKY